MKLPKRIQVGPFTYTVVVDKAAMDALCRAGRTELLGRCDEAQLTIHVEPDQADGQKRDTVLHETLHALVASTGLAEQLDGDLEELIVRALSTAVLDTLRRNPKLVAFLLADG